MNSLPVLQINASPTGWVVAFAGDQSNEVVGEFQTSAEAFAAYRKALSLTETARSGSDRKVA